MITRRPLTIAAAVLLTAGTAFAGLPAATAAPADGAQVSCSGEAYSAKGLPQLRQGDKGVHVLSLQAALNDQAGTTLKGTGYFGAETKKAVVAFQKAHGIKASGIVGPKTWRALGVESDPHFFKTVTLRPGDTEPVPVDTEGSREATELERTDYFLMKLSQRFPEWAPGTPGVQDNRTYDAQRVAIIKEFQRRVGIKPSGIIGPKTSRAMNIWMGYDGYSC